MKKTLHEWLQQLESRHLHPIQMGLDRVRAVADVLQCASFDSMVILIAGTNGKGSTVFALESIYCSAGYRVGTYTSPHLLQFNERIRIDGVAVSDEAIVAAFERIDKIDNASALTYFEMTTLAGLCILQDAALDVIVLEVGLGGRLDATNIVDPDLCIITTIDFDHQAWLGETKEAIAFEKAGIMRSNIPVIYADEDPPKTIITQADGLSAPLYRYGLNYDQGICLRLPFKLELHAKAVSSAIMAIELLQTQRPVDWSQLTLKALNFQLFGRHSIVFKDVFHVFDVAHNPQSARELVLFLQNQSINGKIHFVFSALKDKALDGLIAPFKEIADDWSVGILESSRAAEYSALKAAFSRVGLQNVVYFDTVTKAYQQVKSSVKAHDWIVIYGSFLTVSEVYSSF